MINPDRVRSKEDDVIGLFEYGLSVPVLTPQPLPERPGTVITGEAGLNLGQQAELRVEPLVRTGDRVAQGAPILKDRRRPECVITAPMSGHIAELEIGPGRKLTSLLVYKDDKGESHIYDTGAANTETSSDTGTSALRTLLQTSGLWMRLRARPFGAVPAADASPAALFVMAVDTRPLAPSPRLALEGENEEEWLARGLYALGRLCDGPLYFCQDRGPDILPLEKQMKRLRVGPLHPAGLAGFQIHRHFPARLDRPVWEIDAEDVMAIGQLLSTGRLPATRLVGIAGPGLRETLLVRCQPGADLRELCHAYMTPGQQAILSGSVLEGDESRWLGFRDHQVTVIGRPQPKSRTHWLETALRRASRPEPIIATAAVDQALGGSFAGMALLRALSVNDDETAMDLGLLSLLEEDMGLLDYVTAASPRFSGLLRAALDRIEASI